MAISITRGKVVLATLACAVTATVASSPVPAAASPWHASVRVSGFQFGMPSAYGFFVTGGTAVVPAIGRATVTGSISTCNPDYLSAGESCSVATTYLDLTLTASNGDTIVLRGQNPAAGTLTWSVSSGTGRFATTSGSGTYTFTQLTSEQGTFTLDGTLQVR
jgi:hypothetical protein